MENYFASQRHNIFRNVAVPPLALPSAASARAHALRRC